MTGLRPGFAEPVWDSQACFRAVLEAMARPGTVHQVAVPAEAPAPLDRATAAVVLTLVDAETPVCLHGAASGARGWVAFHCGAAEAELGRAAFVVAAAPVGLRGLAAGTDEAPELGATLILQVAALGSGRVYRLEGPGLAGPGVLRVEGLAAGFAEEWAWNRGRFPRGVDVILCAGDRLAAFPRTLDVREG